MANQTTKPEKPELHTEVAHRLRDPHEMHYMNVLETNDPLLLERGNGTGAWELYHDLIRDGKVYAGLQKRKLAVIARPWQIEPVKDTPKGRKDADTLSDIIRSISFDQLCSGLLDAQLIGWQPAEIVWTIRDGMIVPDRIPMRAHRRFTYVQPDEHLPPQLHLLTKDNLIKGEPLPDRKFIVHRVNPRDDNPYGLGLGLQLFWPVFFKRKGVLAWNKLNDRFGTPTPVGEYHVGATEKEKYTLLSGLKSFSNDGVIMVPVGANISLLESKMSGSFTGHRDLCEYMDDWVMEVLLGQSPRGKGGGAVATAAKEREDVRVELSQADSDLLSETLNRTLLAWICEYNGLEPCQVTRKIEPEEDLKAMAETDKIVSEMGFKPTLERITARYGEGWELAPTINTDTPKKSTDEPQKPASFSEPQDDELDPIDALIAAELSQYEMQDALLKPVQDWLEDTAKRNLTAEDAIAELPDLLDNIDTSLLQEALTQLGFVARIAGNEDVG